MLRILLCNCVFMMPLGLRWAIAQTYLSPQSPSSLRACKPFLMKKINGGKSKNLRFLVGVGATPQSFSQR